VTPVVREEGHDRTGGEVVARLGADHQRLSEMVERIEALLDHLDDDTAAKAFLVHLEFVHEFCEILHFPLEDAMLEVVLEAGLTPAERRLVFVNLAQHQQIYTDAVGVLGRRAGPGASGSAARGEFRKLAETYVKALRGHLDFETRHLQPLFRRQLPPRETVRLDSMLRDLLATLAGKPLERLVELDQASQALTAG